MTELEEIKSRYERRNTRNVSVGLSKYVLFSTFIQKEREAVYKKIIEKIIAPPKCTFLEIGAGTGGNINFFNSIGIPFTNIYANELLEDRLVVLKEKFSSIHILPGDALQIIESRKFDIVFQSTVFTSILDADFKKRLAQKMISLTNTSGLILWYDFIYDNPLNKDVKGISKSEIKKLFPQAVKIDFYPVTLAPPIGRRVGKLYNFVNVLFPFLRTHVVAAIYLK